MRFTERELAKQPLTAEEVRRLSGGKPASLVDRRKPSFKALGVGDRELSDQEAIALIQKDPNIVRRPMFEIDGEVLFGYNEAELEKRL